MQRSICLSLLALSLVLANLQPPQAAQAQGNSTYSGNTAPMAPMGKGTIESPLKSLTNPSYPVSTVGKPRAFGRIVGGRPASSTGATVGASHPSSFGSRMRTPGSKSGIETPLKTAINPGYGIPASSPVVMTPSAATPLRAAGSKLVIDERVVGVDANGIAKVAPGKVNWHGNFELARAAGAASGKPVLQFAMIGSLDDKFC